MTGPIGPSYALALHRYQVNTEGLNVALDAHKIGVMGEGVASIECPDPQCRTHYIQNTYDCDRCGKVFTTMEGLNRHINWNSAYSHALPFTIDPKMFKMGKDKDWIHLSEEEGHNIREIPINDRFLLRTDLYVYNDSIGIQVELYDLASGIPPETLADVSLSKDGLDNRTEYERGRGIQ
jgi:uncharacterized C2H2 Zn-finger protein